MADRINRKYPRIGFQELKGLVGIDDVAYSLGYRLNRRAGVGRYFEMVLRQGGIKQDALIIKNSVNKSAQTYFRRDGSRGDVVTFVKENLSSFNATGKNEWQKTLNVLTDMAHLPKQTYREDLQYINSNRGSKPFNPDRYDIEQIDLENIPGLLSVRGFTYDTVKTMAPFIRLISDRQNNNFSGFNIGFPYTSGCQEGVVGYEIRGLGGFKSKATGTDSSSAAWVADFSFGNGSMVNDVYFFESAFDAMAYYQLHNTLLNERIRPFALVSLGGTFSERQILGVIDRFPNADLYDCFDNDRAGRLNAVRLSSIAENIPIMISKTPDSVSVKAKGKSITINQEQPIRQQLMNGLGFKGIVHHSTPPSMYKDWNDCLLGKPAKIEFNPSKYERNERLAERRNAGRKF